MCANMCKNDRLTNKPEEQNNHSQTSNWIYKSLMYKNIFSKLFFWLTLKEEKVEKIHNKTVTFEG